MKYWLSFSFLWLLLACSTSPLERQPASYNPMEPTRLQNRLKPFTTNGCPRLVGAISYPQEDQWKLCCVEHDKAYWKGGSLEERQKADSDLHACITSRGATEAARLVYYQIRSSHKNSKEAPWGYGWVLPRSLTPHTPHELSEIQKMEATLPSDLSQILSFAKQEKIIKTDSLTDNRCVDAAVTLLQRDLNKSLTPTQVYYESKNLVIGFEDTVKITTRECPLPYIFRFHLKAKKDCESKKTNPLQLDSFEIPTQCE